MSTELSRLQRPADFISDGRTTVFPSPTSWQWFVRTHRHRLLAGGALLKVGNRLLVDPPKFDAVVVDVGQEQAA